MDKFLQLVPQEVPHDYVIITANRAALEGLREAIDMALSGVDAETGELCPPDGEGFYIRVNWREEGWKQFQQRTAPVYYWNKR